MILMGSEIGDLNNCCYTDSNNSLIWSAAWKIVRLIVSVLYYDFYYVKNGFALYSFIFQTKEKTSYQYLPECT